MITEARTGLRLTVPLETLFEMAKANKVGVKIDWLPGPTSDYGLSGRLELVIRRQPLYVSRPSERIYMDDQLVGYLPRESDHAPDGFDEVRELRWNGDSVTPATARALLAAAKEAKEPPPEMLEFLAMLNGLIPDA